MNDVDRRFWPYSPRFSLAAVLVVLVSLLVTVAVLKSILQWPDAQSDSIVLIGVLLLSLLPVVLAVLDVIIERGGAIEYGSVKIDFSQGRKQGASGITVPPNIGVKGLPLTDSSTTQILDTLRQATAAELVVIDLEDGQAWWETRLLVLVSGAVRLGKPDKFVFVAKDSKINQHFEGWGYARDLFSHLVGAHPQYARSLQSAWAAAQQWDLVEPLDSAMPGDVRVAPPPVPPWLSGRLATAHQWMAFDANTGLHNDLFAEQLLQSDLGAKIETQEGSRLMTLAHMRELFLPILNMQHVDLNWTPDEQLETFLDSDADFLAITKGDTYSALVPRAVLSNQVLRAVVRPEKEA